MLYVVELKPERPDWDGPKKMMNTVYQEKDAEEAGGLEEEQRGDW